MPEEADCGFSEAEDGSTTLEITLPLVSSKDSLQLVSPQKSFARACALTDAWLCKDVEPFGIRLADLEGKYSVLEVGQRKSAFRSRDPYILLRNQRTGAVADTAKCSRASFSKMEEEVLHVAHLRACTAE